MKRCLIFVLIFVLGFSFITPVFAENTIKNAAENESFLASSGTEAFDIDAESAILIEASTGKILYSKNENAARSPASVTKIMTLLLAAEALDKGIINLTDSVTISGYAASMGGSQVFLEEGEKITVEELFKSTIIASANDSAVALAELVYGSESAFVNKMNAKAIELGLSATNFENVTGLDDTTENHVSSAMDIAIMSKELIKHDIILKYSSLWQDSIRNGEFTLTNTNRLVRYYDGCNGLKTGSTDKAGYCVSATAKRDGMQLIAVIMGAKTRDIRNECARMLLDYGFSGHSVYTVQEKELCNIPVIGGKNDSCLLYSSAFSALIPKGAKVEIKYNIPKEINARVIKGAPIGSIEYFISEDKIGESIVYAASDVDKIGYFDLFIRLLSSLFC